MMVKTEKEQWTSSLTRKTIDSVSLFKLATYFLSLVSASEPYSFQYVADVSPYLVEVSSSLSTFNCAG